MKFSIRDLMWLTVVVALAVAWWLDRSRLSQRLKEAEADQAIVQVWERDYDFMRSEQMALRTTN